MSIFKLSLLYYVTIFTQASRILICVPSPSISHQVVFYPLIGEFLKRNHEVIYITTDPMYPKGKSPVNLTELNTHDLSYNVWKEYNLSAKTNQGNTEDLQEQTKIILPLAAKSFVKQIQTTEVQDLIRKKIRFDVVIVEGVCKSAQALSYVFDAPIILMNSLGGIQNNYHVMGAPIYPKLLYPIFWHQKLYNLTIFNKIQVLWDTYRIEKEYDIYRIEENRNMKSLFGPDTPSLEELGNRVSMLFLNVYPIWDFNRPVPPGVIYIGGIHQQPQNILPLGLKSYVDSSERGVVYFSMGTNCNPSTLSAEKIMAIANGLAILKYDVLIKWDHDELPGKGNNTKVVRWVPQSDLLRHPKIKASVTQGGLQSFDEAMSGGVPLVGIPMFADQWYNVERYVSLKIGIAIMEDLTENLLVDAVNAVIDDPSYRENMISLREKVRDQPESGLQRAAYWTEHVIRHRGAQHLRAPAANMAWPEYLDLELLAVLALTVLLALAAVLTASYYVAKFIRIILHVPIKLKTT